ncbi:MAG: hypothetical protein KDJ45_06085 [Hyphomicrobiaceae bacterium]|nr:hypothetical protein [Hyphomicrobiaceae bacterium]
MPPRVQSPSAGAGLKIKIASPSNFDHKAASVINSFNTWAFKRDQPTEPELLAQTVAARIAADLPLSFVLYWGKGPRSRIAPPDIACLDYLAEMGKRIKAVHPPGALFHLCQTDTHARLNGHSEAAITSYFADITRAARERGMRTELLSTLVENLKNSGDTVPDNDDNSQDDAAMIASLEKSAQRWYRGDGDASQGARTYLAMNRIESRAVAHNHRGAIFVTFNGRRYRDLFPANMPVFFMYSLKRGTAVKPWFMDAGGQAYPDASAAQAAGAA